MIERRAIRLLLIIVCMTGAALTWGQDPVPTSDPSYNSWESAYTKIAASYIYSVAAGDQLAVTGEWGGMLALRHLPTGKATPVQLQSTSPILSLGITPDDSMVLCGCHDGGVYSYFPKKDESQRLPGSLKTVILSVKISPDKKLAAVVTLDRIRLLSLPKGETVDDFQITGKTFMRGVLVGNSQYLAGMTKEGEVYTWDLQKKDPPALLLENAIAVASDPVTDDLVCAVFTQRQTQFRWVTPPKWTSVNHIVLPNRNAVFALSADGRVLAAICDRSARGSLGLYETISGQELQRMHCISSISPSWLAFSRDTRHLVYSSSTSNVVCWDLDFHANRDKETTLAAAIHALKNGFAAEAHPAMQRLCQVEAKALPAIRAALANPAKVDRAETLRLVRQLDAEEQEERDQASEKLLAIVPSCDAYLLRFLHQVEGSAEQRDRIRKLLDKQRQERIATDRLLRCLEKMATPEAVRLVEERSRGAEDSWITHQARQTLTRMKSKPD